MTPRARARAPAGTRTVAVEASGFFSQGMAIKVKQSVRTGKAAGKIVGEFDVSFVAICNPQRPLGQKVLKKKREEDGEVKFITPFPKFEGPNIFIYKGSFSILVNTAKNFKLIYLRRF